MNEKHNEFVGLVTQVLPGMMCRVAMPNGHEVLASPSDNLRKRFVRISVGDKVAVELSPSDPDRGRITIRHH